jgi:hypothetical protein
LDESVEARQTRSRGDVFALLFFAYRAAVVRTFAYGFEAKWYSRLLSALLNTLARWQSCSGSSSIMLWVEVYMIFDMHIYAIMLLLDDFAVFFFFAELCSIGRRKRSVATATMLYHAATVAWR